MATSVPFVSKFQCKLKSNKYTTSNNTLLKVTSPNADHTVSRVCVCVCVCPARTGTSFASKSVAVKS